MTSNAPNEIRNAETTRWWMFWRWSPKHYRGRRDRLTPEAQGDAANYSLRSGL